jgi:hypothetical protein
VLADSIVSIFEMLPDLPVNYRNRPIVEVTHQNNGMMQIFAEQNSIAQHLFALELSFAYRESQVTIENVYDRARLNLKIHAKAGARFPARMVT